MPARRPQSEPTPRPTNAPSLRRHHPTPTPLLISRKDAAVLLGGISVATLIRMEANGTLHPVRLNRQARTSQVFYRAADVERLAQGGNDAAH
jgi:hypothetical protein